MGNEEKGKRTLEQLNWGKPPEPTLPISENDNVSVELIKTGFKNDVGEDNSTFEKGASEVKTPSGERCDESSNCKDIVSPTPISTDSQVHGNADGESSAHEQASSEFSEALSDMGDWANGMGNESSRFDH